MEPETPRISPAHDVTAEKIRSLEARFYDFNRHAIGRHDGEGLGFVARNEAGEEVGSLTGYSWADMVEVRQLFVAEPYRRRGLGKALMEAAIAEARARRCRIIWVLSHSFQAPVFYERLGFERAAELRDFPPGHAHVALRMRLG